MACIDKTKKIIDELNRKNEEKKILEELDVTKREIELQSLSMGINLPYIKGRITLPKGFTVNIGGSRSRKIKKQLNLKCQVNFLLQIRE